MNEGIKPEGNAISAAEAANLLLSKPPVEDTAEEQPEIEESVEPDEPVDEAEEAPEDPPEEAPDSRKYRVKIDGEEYEVSEEELVKGYQRQQDYTRKTQETAEARKRIEAEYEAARAERARYAESLKAIESALTVQEPDWNALRQKLPVDQYVKVRDQWEDQQKQLQKVQAERQRVEQIEHQEREKKFQEHLQSEARRLLEVIPEWKDETRSKTERAELLSYAKTLGFTDQELSQVTDSRAVVALRKAMLYDRMQSKALEAKKSVEIVKVVKPSSGIPQQTRAQKEIQQAEKRLAKKKDVHSAVSLLMARSKNRG